MIYVSVDTKILWVGFCVPYLCEYQNDKSNSHSLSILTDYGEKVVVEVVVVMAVAKSLTKTISIPHKVPRNYTSNNFYK